MLLRNLKRQKTKNFKNLLQNNYLKATKQEKITKFFKPLPKPDNNNYTARQKLNKIFSRKPNNGFQQSFIH